MAGLKKVFDHGVCVWSSLYVVQAKYTCVLFIFTGCIPSVETFAAADVSIGLLERMVARCLLL